MFFLYCRFLPERRCGRVESCVVRVNVVAVEGESPRVDS
jgi:hypothetical protein